MPRVHGHLRKDARQTRPVCSPHATARRALAGVPGCTGTGGLRSPSRAPPAHSHGLRLCSSAPAAPPRRDAACAWSGRHGPDSEGVRTRPQQYPRRVLPGAGGTALDSAPPRWAAPGARRAAGRAAGRHGGTRRHSRGPGRRRRGGLGRALDGSGTRKHQTPGARRSRTARTGAGVAVRAGPRGPPTSIVTPANDGTDFLASLKGRTRPQRAPGLPLRASAPCQSLSARWTPAEGRDGVASVGATRAGPRRYARQKAVFAYVGGVCPVAGGRYQFCFTFLGFPPARGVWGEVWEAWGRELIILGRD